jgi:hypothetical protein
MRMTRLMNFWFRSDAVVLVAADHKDDVVVVTLNTGQVVRVEVPDHSESYVKRFCNELEQATKT